ncbi:MAG: type I polyketide synthase, partial [Vicinamibacterales bacterium]
MSALVDRISRLSPARLALLALELQEKLDTLEKKNREPIAIVGMACRLPGGADSPEQLWELLRNGVDAISVVPDRFDVEAVYDPDITTPGRTVTRWGGFIRGVDLFDAALFGITPREAMSLDPQQRLLLETVWEALENGGIAPDGLHDTPTGVFVGIGTSDYAQVLSQAGSLSDIDAYRGTGCISHSPASGRIAYALGLRGPAISVDTACSASLVAVHLACQALRAGECRMALAGGVNVILTPDLFIAHSKAGMMAPDGRCKTFDARADGWVRAEGCGVVALKSLSDAEADGDRVLAIIRGSAVNQDGRSNGLTAPNGPAQEAVIRDALTRGAVSADDISYVEAHGTGTELGDPIELHAVGAVLCGGRSADDALDVGSLKANLGHLEAAAGVASLIKVVLSLRHRTLPPQLHFSTPNPHIDWARFPLRVPTTPSEWRSRNGRRIGGVSSFGFSGTNAHVVVEEAPAVARARPAVARPGHVLTLAGKSDAAVRALAARYAAALAEPGAAELGDVCFTANVGRAQLAERVAVVAESAAEARMRLLGVAAGETAPGVVRGTVRGSARPRVAWLFTGQGAQYPGMGRALYETAPVFRAALERCDAALRGELATPLLDVLYGAAGARIHETAYTQPALCAVEYALAELWRSWGVEPGAVLGHSVGEYVAACVAGVFPVETALRLVAARGRLMQALPP